MKKNAVIAVAGCMAVCMSWAAQAAEAEGNGFYVSAGMSRLDLDFSDGTFRNSAGESVPESSIGIDFDSAPLISLSAGYNWGPLALEMAYEYSLGSSDMSIQNIDARGDFDYRNFRVAGVYRSAGQVYFLARAGLAMPEIETDIPGTHFNMGDSGFIGLGGGYRFSPTLSLELDASRSNDDTTTFTLGLRHHF